jgi:hypothetical protein
MKSGSFKTINKLTGDKQYWSQTCDDNITEPIKKNVMDTQQLTEERLWNYIDGLCNAEEKSAIEQLIDSHLEWKKKYLELLQLNELVSKSELEFPSMRFTKNVMEEIAKYQVAPAAKNYIDKKIIWGIGTFFLTMIAGILIYAFAQIHFTSPSGLNTDATQMINKYNPGNVEWSKYFSSTYVNVFLLINVVLGLFMLDMFLTRRKNQSKHKEA